MPSIARSPYSVPIDVLSLAERKLILLRNRSMETCRSWLAKCRRTLQDLHERRETIKALAALDDSLLRDCGLARSDIRAFVDDPQNSDPRLRLSRWNRQ